MEWEVANTVHMWQHGSPKGGTQAVRLGGVPLTMAPKTQTINKLTKPVWKPHPI